MMSILKCGFPVCEFTYSLRFNFGRTSGQSVPKRRGNSTRVMNADSDAAATADNSDFDYLDSTGKEDYCNGRNGAHRLKLVQTIIPWLHLLRTPNLYWIQVWSFTWLNNTIDFFFFLSVPMYPLLLSWWLQFHVSHWLCSSMALFLIDKITS